MSDLEYDILEELYFLTHFNVLKNKIKVSENVLFEEILSLKEKDWIKYYKEVDGVENPEIKFDEKNILNLYFLASKKGLFAHNSK